MVPLSESSGPPNVKNLKAKGDIEGLIKALNDPSPNPSIRRAAGDALGQIGDAEAVKHIIKILENCEIYDSGSLIRTRRDAIRALGKIGDTQAVERLCVILSEAKSFYLRESAAKALGEIGDIRAVEPLISALRDTSGKVKQYAIEALGQIGDGRAVKPLINEFNYSINNEIMLLAAKQLNHIFLQYIDIQTVWPEIAVLKVERIGLLLKVAELHKEEMKTLVVESLIAALDNTDPRIRKKAAVSLEQLGDTRAIKSLIIALGDEDEDVRRTAAKAVSKLSDEDTIISLIIALKDTNADQRSAAAEALKQAGRPAVEPLIAMLKSVDAEQYQTAAHILEQIGTPAIEPLVALLKEKDANLRQIAAEILGQINDMRAVQPLIIALKDVDEDVCRTITEALKAITGQDIGQDYDNWLRWRQEYVLADIQKLLKEKGKIEIALKKVGVELSEAEAKLRTTSSQWSNATDQESAKMAIGWAEYAVEEVEGKETDLKRKCTNLNINLTQYREELKRWISESTDEYFVARAEEILKIII